MPRKFKFCIGETILCYHGPLIYEAKCVEAVKEDDGSINYFIHYVGWSKKWDEWINEKQVLRYNKRNLSKQAKVKMAYMAQQSIPKPRSRKVENTSKQDNQDMENNQQGISKDQASSSDVPEKLRDEPAIETEKQMLKGEFDDTNSPSSMSQISAKEEEQQKSPSTDIPDKKLEELYAHEDRTPQKDDNEGDGNNSVSSSSPVIPIKVFEVLHSYVEITPDQDVNEGEENSSSNNSGTNILYKLLTEGHYTYADRTQEREVSEGEEHNTANSSGTDVPDKVCEERHESVDRLPEDVAELEDISSGSSFSSDAPVNEFQEPLSFVDCANTILSKTEIKIQLPEELKQCLVEDWNLVCQQKKLVILPEKHNLTSIFNSYLNYKYETSSANSQGGAGREMVSGLELYFTTVLNTHLLYDVEQPQYNDIRSNFRHAPVQRIYGGIHLLRLFVKLGPLLSCSPNMTEDDTVRRLSFYFEDFLQFLLTMKSEYFGREHYEDASEEYLRRVQ